MKIEIERVGGGPVKLSEFADLHGLTMIVKERPRALMRDMRMTGGLSYYAYFHNVEVKEGCMLASKFGNGSSPEEAIRDYAREISGSRIVHRALCDDRREFECPNEWLPEEVP